VVRTGHRRPGSAIVNAGLPHRTTSGNRIPSAHVRRQMDLWERRVCVARRDRSNRPKAGSFSISTRRNLSGPDSGLCLGRAWPGCRGARHTAAAIARARVASRELLDWGLVSLAGRALLDILIGGDRSLMQTRNFGVQRTRRLSSCFFPGVVLARRCHRSLDGKAHTHHFL